jgi:hypothetical protein
MNKMNINKLIRGQITEYINISGAEKRENEIEIFVAFSREPNGVKLPEHDLVA